MEQFTVSKEFILQAHKDACCDWKSRLENKFPGAFLSEYKVGDWITGGGIGRIKSVLSDGFICDNRTDSDKDEKWGVDVRLATPEEIKSHLIALAEKKGFKNGAKFNGSTGLNKDQNIEIGKDHQIAFTFGSIGVNQGLYCGDSWIYHSTHGWGTVVSSVKEVTMQEIAEKFNCKVEELKIKK